MTIHVVQPGDTLSLLAQDYGISLELLMIQNCIQNPNELVVGQSILIIKPEVTYTVKEGDNLNNIAYQHNIPLMQLLRNNPNLASKTYIYPGETLVIQYESNKLKTLETSGFTYPYISEVVLRQTLPYLTYITVFNYQVTFQGTLKDIDDERIIEMSKTYGVAPFMMVSTLDERGVGNAQVIDQLVESMELQDKLIENIINTAKAKGYYGINHSVQYITRENQAFYEDYIKRLGERLEEENLFYVISITPKINIEGTEISFENLDFSKLSEYVDGFLLLTYNWGYSYSPPTSLAPINILQELIDVVTATVPKEKLSIGYPVIGYDWKLPYVPGDSVANAVTSLSAVRLAYDEGVPIQYNQVAEAPYFFYYRNQDLHNVWFKDARSIDAVSKLIQNNGLLRIAIWSIMFFFPQLWFILLYYYDILDLYHNFDISSKNPPSIIDNTIRLRSSDMEGSNTSRLT